ncbi:MAG: class I mannose-6-phosphate isomerase [Chloroflexaceae bacterium]|nr:class I mannose-6-phosphate isomerase [Chloroflexaceae bacterium]
MERTIAQTHPPLYPLLTERRLVEPIWGGTRLAEWLNLPEPRPDQLGETWQIYDANMILNGDLAGRTLADAARELGAALVGTRTVARYGNDMPLLAKFLDANDRLSIQVHPNDDYAHTVEAATGFHGKTEAWYILQATPGATVTYGLNRPCSRDEFAAAVQSDALEPLMHQLPVQAGDVVFVPAGTIHAINAGIVLFEIQQKSDLTYRVYDYGRRDAKTGKLRELHLDKALDVSDFGPAPRGTIAPLPLNEHDQLLVACPYFALEKWQIGSVRHARTNPGSFEILTVIGGSGTIEWGRPDEGGNLKRGMSLLLPAALGNYTIHAADASLTLLRAYVPDLEADCVAPVRAAGATDEQINGVVFLES